MKLSEFAVRRSITTIMFFAAIVMLGGVSFFKLPMQEIPDIAAPAGAAYCFSEQQMSVEELERRIIEPIEGEIAQLPNVKKFNVWSRGGRGAFFPIEFEFGTNVKYRIVDLQDRLDKIRRQFPRRSLHVNAFPFETSWFNKEFMDLVLKAPEDDPYLERINTDRIRQRLNDIDGVANARIFGGKEPTVDVTIFQDKMREFGIPLWQVMNRVQSFANEPVFLGDIEEQGKQLFVRLDGQFKDTSEIEDVILNEEGNLAVRHLGIAENTYNKREDLRRVDGQPALGVDMEREALVNPIELSRRAMKVIDDINEELKAIDEEYELTVTWNSADNIIELLTNLTRLALVGILLSMFVLYMFIRNLRMSLVVCVVIPICIVATFNAMYFLNMSINFVTLMGLAVGVGTLIDSSIVVLENVFRHHERGKSPYGSAIVGTHEVGTAVFALTLTNVVVFLPIVFVEGWVRLVFTEGALAIVIPMIISMLVALTLVPMLTVKVLQISDQKKALFAAKMKKLGEPLPAGAMGIVHTPAHSFNLDWIRRIRDWIPWPSMAQTRRFYGRILKNCLRHRVRFLIAIVLVCLYTYYYTMGQINRDVMQQSQDQDVFYVFVYLPEGTVQEHTVKVVDQVEDILLREVPEAEHIHSWVEQDNASIRVHLKNIRERERESTTIQEDLRPIIESFAAAEVTFSRSRTRGSENEMPSMDTGRGGEIEIRGPEYTQINSIAENFALIVAQVPGIRDVYNDNESGPLEIHFTLDREAASLLQITPNLIAREIQLAQRRGEYATILMKKGDREIDIIFSQYESPADIAQGKDESRRGIKFEELRQIPIYSPLLATTISLEDLGTFSIERSMGSIQRENRERIGRIRFDTVPNSKFQEIEETVKALIESYPLPAGYRMNLAGRSQRVDESIEALRQIVILAVLLMYMCVASLFESFSLPFTILFSIPLALVGIVWAFILTGNAFSEMAGLGVVFLIGMLPNSPILLVHFSNYLRRFKNYPRERAVMMSGYSRLRPILMTVLTTNLGLLPMAFPWRGDEEWVPFAICVIGGLTSSTILTLIIVPGFYFIIEDIANLVKRVFRYIWSWRWVFVFWSHRKRLQVKQHAIAYRVKPPREEPLTITIDHLTRIYAPNRIERMSQSLNSFWNRARILSPNPSLVAPVFQEQEKQHSTLARKKALDQVSITIESGLFGLLGPNGAGKTTLLRILAGLDQPSRGYLSICGYDTKKEARKAQKIVGYLPQYFDVYGHMTAYQYLEYFALLKGIKRKRERKEAIEKALEMVNLLDQKNVPVGQFSGGMKRRVGLAQLLVKAPKVIIVDEPTVGLDPIERLRFRNLLVKLSKDRIVILSTHIVEDVERCSRNIALIDQGKVFYQGSPDRLIETVKGCVWEITLSEEEEWFRFRREYKVSSQVRTAEGIRLRVISPTRPAENAVEVEPNLEEAYLYHTRRQTGSVN